MFSRVKWLCVLASAFLTSTTSYAAKIEIQKDDELTVIIIEGDFVLGDERKFADAAISTPDALVVLGSNGGNLYAGIEIGTAIRLKGFTTLVPDNTRCASACALAWLGGRIRAMGTTAEVGFHAASNADNGQVTSSGNALVGAYLSKIGLPSAAVVYITEPPPNSIRWLTATDAAKYGIDVKVLSLPANSQTSNVTPDQSTPSRRSGSSKKEQQAVATVQGIYASLQGDNNSVLRKLDSLYANEVLYFGKNVDKKSILVDKEKFFNRWPNRAYRLDRDQFYVSCLAQSCTVNGQVDWQTSSPQRNADANGSASFSYTLDFSNGSPLIVAETSTVTKRDRAYTVPPPQPAATATVKYSRNARDFFADVFDRASRDTVTAKKLYNEIYPDRIFYYGKYRDRKSVLNDKFNFLNRWPQRQYTIDPTQIETKCSGFQCEVRGIVAWAVKAENRNAFSQGSSAFVYIVDFSAGSPIIVGENSATMDRNVQKIIRPRRRHAKPAEDDLGLDIEF